MSTRPPDNNTGPLDHLSVRYLREALDIPHPTDEPYVFNAIESRVIRRTKLVVLTLSAIFGTLGVCLYCVPQHNWPTLFSTTTLLAFGQIYEVPLATTLYGLLLVYLMINLLLTINEWGVKMIMEVCQFPRAHDTQYERHVQALADVTIKKTLTGFFRLGLDPFLTMPRWGLPIFFLLNIVKAALTILALHFLLERFLGEYAIRQVIDYIAVLVYAGWNSRASWQVLHEAQIRVMAPITIREFVHELQEEWGKFDPFSPVIMEALQYTSVLEHPANYAHFLLTETIVDQFGLSADGLSSNDFAKEALALPQTVRRSLERLIVFAVLIDGRLSWTEKRLLRKLRQNGFLTYSASEIQRISADYNQGKGLWV